MGPSTQLNAAQREIPLLSVARQLYPVQQAVLNNCESLLDAIHICIQLGRLPHYVIAKKLGVDKGHWTRMMQGQAHFPTNKIHQLMEVCGNLAPLQYLAKQTGIKIVEDSDAVEERILEQRLAALRATRQSTGLNDRDALAA